MSKPLDGIKVLDLSKVLAGPLCAQYLGDLGAEVIKVEAVGQGDETRGWPPFPAPGLGTVFLSANRNKRSIAINMKSDRGRKLVHELAKSADVAIESFGTGVAERLGIDATSLCALNDRLVHCSISGFGRTGPLKNSPGYDLILQAFSGIMSMTGDEGGGYIRSPISPIDQMTGVHAFSGILASLFAREKTGRGASIQVSLFDTALGLLGYNLQTFWERGTQPAKCGSSHESLCPYQAFEAADGPIMIGVANDNLWRKFCGVAGLNAIVDAPKFRTNADRVKHRAETLQYVQSVIATKTVAHWNAVLSEVGIPCSPINTLAQLLEHPHTKADTLIMQYDHPAAGRLNCVGHPVTFVGNERSPGLPPPMLGQHTDEVLKELGLSAASIAELRRDDVIS
ncbi:CaiB/BaiF CoA-transferase family protein [Bradyrhizobium sp. CCGUVB23]|uniref:CaiB/BaiF CoA transferase family protein n=1 Tax=Bradyrhizobium sp. CCGUVB23 TaxID=2949630 RepID=UPI0020B21B6A|nr:CoA transferase [Bradyrhizobium sp. CCGUVB23]MCP3465521.1 CoA transferase [Bradyrhizobium sp. CCGUVB23]